MQASQLSNSKTFSSLQKETLCPFKLSLLSLSSPRPWQPLIYFLFILFFLLSYYCCTRSTLWYLQKCLQYILVKLTPFIILFYLPSPILRIVLSGLIFPFSYMIHNISTIFTLLHPFLISPASHGAPHRTCLLFYFILIFFGGTGVWV
jgi:hypothetical protein